TAFLSINHQGQFPAVTLSFNLAPGVSLGQATQAIRAAQNRLQVPPTLMGTFQGTAGAFQASLASEPLLILAAIIAVYIILGALPLMLGHGTGSELRQPLGYTMVGGLILSQLLTLFTTPVVYLYLDRVNLWLTKRRRAVGVGASRLAAA